MEHTTYTQSNVVTVSLSEGERESILAFLNHKENDTEAETGRERERHCRERQSSSGIQTTELLVAAGSF